MKRIRLRLEFFLLPIGLLGICFLVDLFVGWRLLGGLLAISVRPDASIFFWKLIGLSAKTTFLIVVSWTSFTLWLTYFLAGLADQKIVKPKRWRKRFQEIVQEIPWLNKWIEKWKRKVDEGRAETLHWLIVHHNFFILLILFIPFTPLIESIAIVAARLTNMKKALPLLLLANLGKIILVILLVYGF